MSSAHDYHKSYDLVRSFQAYGIQKSILELLFFVFPNKSFERHFDTFKEAVNDAISKYGIYKK